VLEYFYYPSK